MLYKDTGSDYLNDPQNVTDKCKKFLGYTI